MKIYKNKKYIIPFFIFNECLIIIMMLSLLLQSTYSVFLFIMIIFFNVVSFYIYLKIYTYIQETALMDAQKILYEKQFQIQREHESIQKENHRFMKKISQDIFQQLQNQSLETIPPKEMRSFAEKLMHQHTNLYQNHYCENQMIDAILYNKSIITREYDIPFHIHVYVPQQLSIEPIDLISLYTNLLDNAIEASLLSDKEKRFIDIHSHCYNDYLIIQISNHYQQSSPHFLTTKKNKQEHGLGLQIVQQILNKYHGMMDIQSHNQTLQINITLKAIPIE